MKLLKASPKGTVYGDPSTEKFISLIVAGKKFVYFQHEILKVLHSLHGSRNNKILTECNVDICLLKAGSTVILTPLK
jgi:hypothetical protein